MREGTGLVDYSSRFPERFYDVGIAEGHAVTFSGGYQLKEKFLLLQSTQLFSKSL